MRKTTLRGTLWVGGLALVLATGYVSSLVSLGPCARSTRRDLVAFFDRAQLNTPLRWIDHHKVTDRWANGMPNRGLLVPEYRRLDRFIRLRLFEPTDTFALPWAFARPEITMWPFIVRVDYGVAVEPLAAQFGTQVYATFFGIRYRLGDWPVLQW